jgi:hypothetical protein
MSKDGGTGLFARKWLILWICVLPALAFGAISANPIRTDATGFARN